MSSHEISKTPLQLIFNHILCWLGLILYELFITYLSIHNLFFVSRAIIYYTCNILIFYAQVFILQKTIGAKSHRNTKLLVILTLLQSIIFLSLKLTIDYLTTDFSISSDSNLEQLKRMGILDMIRGFYFTALAALYWFVKNVGIYRKRTMEAELDRLKTAQDHAKLKIKLAETQNAYMQQQISPHLLLNSLSFIHSAVFKISEEAAESVILLSDIFRFSLEPTDNEGKIDLNSEIEQMENLIKLNRPRFANQSDVEFIIIGNPSGHRIIPLILLTLAENVFKHGDLNDHVGFIRLNITDSGHLTFETENHKRPIPRYQRLRSNGIENCRIRLDYAYGSNYSLQIVNSEDVFSVKLSIEL